VRTVSRTAVVCKQVVKRTPKGTYLARAALANDDDVLGGLFGPQQFLQFCDEFGPVNLVHCLGRVPARLAAVLEDLEHAVGHGGCAAAAPRHVARRAERRQPNRGPDDGPPPPPREHVVLEPVKHAVAQRGQRRGREWSRGKRQADDVTTARGSHDGNVLEESEYWSRNWRTMTVDDALDAQHLD